MLSRLTSAQAARLSEWCDKWLEIGFSCEPCDLVAAKEAVVLAYAAAGLSPPTLWLVMGSPIGGALAATCLRDQAGAQARARVWARVRDQVGDQVGDQAWAQAWDQVGDQVWAQVGDQVRDQVRAQVWAQVGDQVRDQVRAQVWDQVGDQVRDQVRAQCFGSHDAAWLAFYDFFLSALGMNCCRPLRGLIELAKCCGWWAPYKRMVILQHRHCVLHRDSRHRLHCETGPAVAYRDGFEIYAWHGVRVPAWVIDRPTDLTAAKIDAEPNVEIRRVMVTRFGAARWLFESGAENLGSDEFGTLWRKPRKDDSPLLMVEVENSTPEPDGSRKRYFLRVPPDVQTARQAVAWTFGKTGKDYAPVAET